MIDELWPALPLEAWQDTYSTLHMWMQIVGKIRLARTPLISHWWNVPFYVTARGLTTSAMPYKNLTFEIDFDFIDHQLFIRCNDGGSESISLEPRSVADFYHQFTRNLRDLGIEVNIWPVPVEVKDPVRFDKDYQNASYDPVYANRFWRILVQTDKVFTEFRSRFLGKCSPVHFFWGSLDMAVTRFSGRGAPEREGADMITREAYSHEAISHGFWPGAGSPFKAPAFYSYTAPEPPGLSAAPLRPSQAFYSNELKEFILLYDDVRQAASPEALLMEFLQSTYEAGANLAHWNRAELERA